MSFKLEDFISKVKFVEPKPAPKAEPEKAQTQPPPVGVEKSRSLVFQSDLAKFRLNKFAPAKDTANPPKSPADYFEIDKQADEFIKKHTDDSFSESSLKTDDLGAELADIARTDL